MTNTRRLIPAESKILADAEGLVEYVASEQVIDAEGELIRSAGWRFNRFSKNAPFIDSHQKGTVKSLLGQVIDFRIEGNRLIETVKWAIDVAENELARLGYAMTKAGYLKAVSVGFLPLRMADSQKSTEYAWRAALRECALESSLASRLRRIYLEQEQTELSAVVAGSNPLALAKAFKDGLLSERDLETLCSERSKCETANPAVGPDAAGSARHQAQEAFLGEMQKIIARL